MSITFLRIVYFFLFLHENDCILAIYRVRNQAFDCFNQKTKRIFPITSCCFSHRGSPCASINRLLLQIKGCVKVISTFNTTLRYVYIMQNMGVMRLLNDRILQSLTFHHGASDRCQPLQVLLKYHLSSPCHFVALLVSC